MARQNSVIKPTGNDGSLHHNSAWFLTGSFEPSSPTANEVESFLMSMLSIAVVWVSSKSEMSFSVGHFFTSRPSNLCDLSDRLLVRCVEPFQEPQVFEIVFAKGRRAANEPARIQRPGSMADQSARDKISTREDLSAAEK